MSIKFYIVGGYVRDRILGREAKDHDFVVTGATVEDMKARGFVLIEAQSFPVFHHPLTRDEYALARVEKKTGPGYHGFQSYADVHVTIEDDLLRRDLTCNAMAREVLDWNDEGHAKLSDELIDPYGGLDDLRNGVLRHVSEAFAEDPLRVLRVARFAARYNFDVHPETIALMKQLTDSGELDHLTNERVWNELTRALMSEQPSRFFWELEKCGAKTLLFPELRNTLIHSGYFLSKAALRNATLEERLMILLSGIHEKDAEKFLTRLKAPSDEVRLVLKFNRLLTALRTYDFLVEFTHTKDADQLLQMLKNLDAFRRPDDMFILSSALGFFGNSSKLGLGMDALLVAFREARKVSFATLTDEQKADLEGERIGRAIDELRIIKIQEVM